MNFIKLISLLFLVSIFLTENASAQHPGIAGENAPGGEEVYISAQDISIGRAGGFV